MKLDAHGIRWCNFAGTVGLPLALAVSVPRYVSLYGVAWPEVVALVAGWALTGLGITAGYHHHFSHRAWSANSLVVGMLIFAGLLRVMLVHQFTFMINSVCRYWGARPWNAFSSARGNSPVAFLTFGEGYHNYHHEHPTDYRNGPRWYRYDPTKWVIRLLCRIGLAKVPPGYAAVEPTQRSDTCHAKVRDEN